jgi:Protein of unknown function (DUF1838)
MSLDIIHGSSHLIARRHLIGGLVTVSAATLSACGNALEASERGGLALTKPLDFSKPENNLLGFVRLIGDTSGKGSYAWGHGRVFGTLENELSTPLFDYQSCRLTAFKPRPDGSWQMGYRGLILFTDLKSGKVIDSFRNPFTDKDNSIVHFKTAFGNSVYTANGAFSLVQFENQGPHDEKPFILPWTVVGDDTWVTYDERIAYRRPDGAWRVDNAVYRYHGLVSELTNPTVTAPQHNMMWSTELNWFTFMDMGARAGHIMWAGMGRKYDRLDAMPPDFIAEAERRYPGFLSQPISWENKKP